MSSYDFEQWPGDLRDGELGPGPDDAHDDDDLEGVFDFDDEELHGDPMEDF